MLVVNLEEESLYDEVKAHKILAIHFLLFFFYGGGGTGKEV